MPKPSRTIEQRRAERAMKSGEIELILTTRAALAKELCHCGPDAAVCGRAPRGKLCEHTAEEWLRPAIGPDSPDFMALALARRAAGTLSPEIGRWLERHGHASP